MKITIQRVGDRDLNALYGRVREIAEAHGMTENDGVRQALHLWMERFGKGPPSRSFDVTDKEAAAIEALLAVIREAKS